ncbi:uncharacterized protein F5891DRAFT_641571 [Suillus fuscotomentosus]|uniref:Uncharacterized protein n=1 Tax=Suillus fuscotomentosus TaxID=1912939 RepID=A0AAD4DXY2_9AGAM|nr:uncharacterized protein F5891DRAFT_641571 [Suillus fuscotomentosus]KAG1896002.1 hypothetical protein F5891DRAFT_641571 [Suillus fuscotomentosus]
MQIKNEAILLMLEDGGRMSAVVSMVSLAYVVERSGIEQTTYNWLKLDAINKPSPMPMPILLRCTASLSDIGMRRSDSARAAGASINGHSDIVRRTSRAGQSSSSITDAARGSGTDSVSSGTAFQPVACKALNVGRTEHHLFRIMFVPFASLPASCPQTTATNVLQQTSLRAPATTARLDLPGVLPAILSPLYFLACNCLFGASIKL